MFKGLKSDVDSLITPKATSPSVKASRSMDLQAQINLLNISLHVMHGTWLSWALQDTLGFVNVQTKGLTTYGMQLASQRINLAGRPDASTILTPTSYSSIKLALPALRLFGRLEKNSIRATLNIEKFDLMLKPQYVDDILVVQQKFGSDFTELVDVVAANKPKRSSTPRSSTPRSTMSLLIGVKLGGFKIGVQGPMSTQYIESPAISAEIEDGPLGRRWKMVVSALQLYLVHDSPLRHPSTDGAEYRSAYMILDCEMHNDLPVGVLGDADHITFSVSRIHALLMPAAISELGDLVDHVQASRNEYLFVWSWSHCASFRRRLRCSKGSEIVFSN